MTRRVPLHPQRRDHMIAGFAALAIVIHILEAGVPTPIPGIKPGLANVITLLVLLRHDFRAAVWVQLLRVLVGSLLIGSFLTPTFLLSLAGAGASLLALGALTLWNRALPLAQFSPIGLGVAAACAHMSGQFLVAYSWFIPHIKSRKRCFFQSCTACLIYSTPPDSSSETIALAFLHATGPRRLPLST